MLIGFRCGECTQMLFAVFVYSSESYNQFPRTHDIFHFSLRTQFSSALLVYSLSFSLCLQSTSLVCLSFNISFVITSIHSGHVQIFMQCIPFKFRLCILQCLIYFGVVTFSSYTCTFEKKEKKNQHRSAHGGSWKSKTKRIHEENLKFLKLNATYHNFIEMMTET